MHAVVLGGESECGLLTKVFFRIESEGVVEALDNLWRTVRIVS
jgi:hypothetical protein